jgi:hypothetical protein
MSGKKIIKGLREALAHAKCEPVDVRSIVEVCAQVADEWTDRQTVRLRAGEMTAQEMRTVIAVARGIAEGIRNLVSVAELEARRRTE